MKEYLKKFSADKDEGEPETHRIDRIPPPPEQPAFHDLRFVVKESLNLGLRVFGEIERMLKKLED